MVEAHSLGGRQARRVHFWPSTGKALMKAIEDADSVVSAAERRYVQRKPVAPDTGDVELF